MFTQIIATTSFVSGHHVPTDSDFETGMYFDGSEIHFSGMRLYYQDGSEVPSVLGLDYLVESDLRTAIYAHPIYQDILREYEPDDYDWHQQWKEDEAMGN